MKRAIKLPVPVERKLNGRSSQQAGFNLFRRLRNLTAKTTAPSRQQTSRDDEEILHCRR